MKKRFEGREFEYLFSQDINIVLWGAANIGKRFLDFYLDSIHIVKVCDGNLKRIGTQLNGFTIENPDSIENDENTIVIVTCSFYSEIRPKLEKRGFAHNVSCFYYDDFERILTLYKYGHLRSNRVDISLTEKCTLNCKHCNMFMPHFSNPKEQPLESVLHDIELYFDTVDFVKEMELLGGEPFLYKELPAVMRFVQEVFLGRVGQLNIFTNATIIPSDEVLILMKQLNVHCMISDYSRQVPYQEKLCEFKRKLDLFEIPYFAPVVDTWVDFGFPDNVSPDSGEKESRYRFEHCLPPFRGLYEGKIWYCHLETSAMRAGLFPEIENDYYTLDNSVLNKKFDYLEFDLGYTKNGYVTFCEKCRGCDCVNDTVVPFGEQAVR